ncbi:MAG: hypothetical protein AAGA20_07800 [Planctomycetota bacterium]
MRNTLLALGALALAVTTTGCLTPDTMYVARPIGGIDDEGASDGIYFELRNAGEAVNGIWVLRLPDDWPERPRTVDEDGVLRLVDLLEPTWIPAVDPVPPIELQNLAEPWLVKTTDAPRNGEEPFLRVVGTCPDPESIRLHERFLKPGQSIKYELYQDLRIPWIGYQLFAVVECEERNPNGMAWIWIADLSFPDTRNELESFVGTTNLVLGGALGTLVVEPAKAVAGLFSD